MWWLKQYQVIIVLLLLLSVIVASSVSAVENPTIVNNEVILTRDDNNYTEVRHIVLEGSNFEIGQALGEIAQKDYNVTLGKFADPIYANARLLYMQENYPPFYERMRGVAKAYNVSFESTDLDLSILPYDVGTVGCSVVYFPPSVTENGHAMACRNMDYNTAPFEVLIGKKVKSNDVGMFARTYVLELYPDECFSSLVIGGHDMMETFFQGINSEGLAIELLEDDSPSVAITPVSGGRNSGMPDTLAARMVLDTCKNIEEAKLVFLNNRIYFPLWGQHFMIYDKFGNATIVEFFAEDGSIHFTDASNAVCIMTNHPVALYPTLDTFPESGQNASHHDTFLRYKTLTNISENHKGKFTIKDMIDALATVYAETNCTMGAMEVPIPERTTTNSVVDLTNGTISARFYLRDGPTDPVLGGPSNVFSPFFHFTLANSKPN